MARNWKEYRERRKRREQALGGKNEFGISDPTPLKAVAAIIKREKALTGLAARCASSASLA